MANFSLNANNAAIELNMSGHFNLMSLLLFEVT